MTEAAAATTTESGGSTGSGNAALTTGVREDPKTFPGMLVAFKAQIAAALPTHINADRMARIALTCFRLNPRLAQCPPASVFAAVIQAAQQGLEPGLNGRAYLVPYYNNKTGQYECQFIPGWKGLVELANRTGRAACWTGAVFQGDDFSYELGDDPHVHHRPGVEDDPKKLDFVYAIGRIKGNDYPIVEVWPIEKVRRHFIRYNKVGDKHYAHENWEMYARKVPLLQVLKYLPASPELEAAIAMSYAADAGSQGLNIKDAIDGSFMPVPDSADDEKPKDQGGSKGKLKGKLQEKQQTAPAQQASAGPVPSYAEIAASMNEARNGDAVDAAEATVDAAVTDPKQRVELHDLAKARRLELRGGGHA